MPTTPIETPNTATEPGAATANASVTTEPSAVPELEPLENIRFDIVPDPPLPPPAAAAANVTVTPPAEPEPERPEAADRLSGLGLDLDRGTEPERHDDDGPPWWRRHLQLIAGGVIVLILFALGFWLATREPEDPDARPATLRELKAERARLNVVEQQLNGVGDNRGLVAKVDTLVAWGGGEDGRGGITGKVAALEQQLNGADGHSGLAAQVADLSTAVNGRNGLKAQVAAVTTQVRNHETRIRQVESNFERLAREVANRPLPRVESLESLGGLTTDQLNAARALLGTADRNLDRATALLGPPTEPVVQGDCPPCNR